MSDEKLKDSSFDIATALGALTIAIERPSKLSFYQEKRCHHLLANFHVGKHKRVGDTVVLYFCDGSRIQFSRRLLFDVKRLAAVASIDVPDIARANLVYLEQI